MILAVNKVDSDRAGTGTRRSCYRLGFAPVLPISAEHGRGVAELLEAARDRAPAPTWKRPVRASRVAIIGRPNVGQVVARQRRARPRARARARGARHDARHRRHARRRFATARTCSIDTAGIRRKGRCRRPLEKLSVVMALKSLERTRRGRRSSSTPPRASTAQDAHIAGYADEAGRALVLAVNKWDLVPRGLLQKADVVGADLRAPAVPRVRARLLHLGGRAPGPAASCSTRSISSPPRRGSGSSPARCSRRCARRSSGGRCQPAASRFGSTRRSRSPCRRRPSPCA